MSRHQHAQLLVRHRVHFRVCVAQCVSLYMLGGCLDPLLSGKFKFVSGSANDAHVLLETFFADLPNGMGSHENTDVCTRYRYIG